jgi:hypothetical protein
MDIQFIYLKQVPDGIRKNEMVKILKLMEYQVKLQD